MTYGETSGHSGTDTSRDRALAQDASGQTKSTEHTVLTLVHRRGSMGATWQEVSQWTGMHHGAVSGALTRLHKSGRLLRLTEIRGHCRVYVYPGYEQDRPTDAPNRTATTELLDAAAVLMERAAESSNRELREEAEIWLLKYRNRN